MHTSIYTQIDYCMKKVINSVEKLLVAPTTLGIQSIIIGSHPPRLEENKDYTAGNILYLIICCFLDKTNIMNRTKLEPLPIQTKTEQRLSNTLNQVLRQQDSSRTGNL